jgi:hypothetical protein
MVAFLTQWFLPISAVAAHQSEPLVVDFSWNTWQVPGFGNADLVVTVTNSSGVVVWAGVVEVDTLQHAGRGYDSDKERVIATLLQLRRLHMTRNPHVKVGVIHFNLRDTAVQSVALQKGQETQRRKRQAAALESDLKAQLPTQAPKSLRLAARQPPAAPAPELTRPPTEDAPVSPRRDVANGRDMTAAQRWQLLRAWVLHMAVLQRARFPRSTVLYLCYDEDNSSRIVWPLGNGVCGCTSRAPRVSDVHAVDWGSSPGLSLITRGVDRGDHTLSPHRLKGDSEVFGVQFGPNAQAPVAGL